MIFPKKKIDQRGQVVHSNYRQKMGEGANLKNCNGQEDRLATGSGLCIVVHLTGKECRMGSQESLFFFFFF